MAKSIEKILEDIEVPEMEYTSQKKHKTVSNEVPEVVLPKTKAEEYEEAKGRLTQKTTAASKAYSADKHTSRSGQKQVRQKSVKTVELESAAAAAVGSQSNAQKSAEKKNVEELKKRLNSLRKVVEEPKWVGGADDLIPFAWAHPLIEVPRPSKYYRQTMRADKNRALLLPVPHEKQR